MKGLFKKGDKVRVFDHRLFRDDVSTPLSVTMKDATILCVYDDMGVTRKLYDIRFHHDGRRSNAHFEHAITKSKGQL